MEKALLNNLKNDIYCRIQPSKYHGVGVFAIRDIPKHTNPFKETGSYGSNPKIIDIPKLDIDKLHPEIKKMVDDFYVSDKGVYGIPYRGLNSNNISFYLNSSKKPNMAFKSMHGYSMVVFYTIRKINKGEELLVDYDKFYG
jgi:SET domain-containing protein